SGADRPPSPDRRRRVADRFPASPRDGRHARGVVPAMSGPAGARQGAGSGAGPGPMEERLAELARRLAHVQAGGGPDRTAKQHEAGKLTARERLARLFDPETFTEIDAFTQHRATEFGMAGRDVPADAVVTGFGRVHGRTVYAFAQDFTVMGGT